MEVWLNAQRSDFNCSKMFKQIEVTCCADTTAVILDDIPV